MRIELEPLNFELPHNLIELLNGRSRESLIHEHVMLQLQQCIGYCKECLDRGERFEVITTDESEYWIRRGLYEFTDYYNDQKSREYTVKPFDPNSPSSINLRRKGYTTEQIHKRYLKSVEKQIRQVMKHHNTDKLNIFYTGD
jgi:hypothetical protein